MKNCISVNAVRNYGNAGNQVLYPLGNYNANMSNCRERAILTLRNSEKPRDPLFH
jgi:hypothetical protein